MLSILLICKVAFSSTFYKWTRERAGRWTIILCHIWSLGVGYLTSTLSGGMGMNPARPSGCRVSAENFPTRPLMPYSDLRWLESAKERALRDPVADGRGRLVAGVDVGGGGAETVVYVCERKARGYRIVKLGF